MNQEAEPQITIRQAALEDAARLADIHVASWHAAYPGIIPDEVLRGFTPDKRQAAFERQMREGIAAYTLLFEGETAAGFMSLGKSWDADAPDTCGEVWSLYLRPECWGRGLGARLMRWGLAELKKRGFQEATLWVLEENSAACAFYERLGFARDGAVKDIEIGKTLRECRYHTGL